jgi:hypothetical protein
MCRVAICMPYFERIFRLSGTIATFKARGYFDDDYPYDVKVSIVDDGSIKHPLKDDGPDYAVISKLPPKENWLNPCVPLNIAVNQIDSELILLQSPEVSHQTDVVGSLAAKVKGKKDVALAYVRNQGPGLEWYSHPEFRPKKYWFCQMMTRELWDEVGGFDERYRDGQGWDDDYFERELTRHGANWIWVPDAVATHHKVKREYRLPRKQNRSLYEKG